MPITGEDTIAHAILQIAAKQTNGRASYDLIHRELPNIVTLTQDDLVTSETRPNEPMWYQTMRNIRSHHLQKGNYIWEGFLEHVSQKGNYIFEGNREHFLREKYRITSLGRTLL